MGVKVVSFVGRSNSGKTTLITRLIPLFGSRNLKVGTIKHTHHQAEFDKTGKDSWQHRQSGSQQVLVMSHDQLALYSKRPQEMSLHEAAGKWFSDFDLVISEGFKNEPGLKIEVFRHDSGKTPLYADPSFEINALISDQNPDLDIPFFRFEDLDKICDWILERLDIESA